MKGTPGFGAWEVVVGDVRVEKVLVILSLEVALAVKGFVLGTAVWEMLENAEMGRNAEDESWLEF